jgi:hypothetical protein
VGPEETDAGRLLIHTIPHRREKSLLTPYVGSPSAQCLFVRAKDLLLSDAARYMARMSTPAPGAQFEIRVDGIVRTQTFTRQR